MKKRINYTNILHKSLLSYYVFSKRSKLIKNKKYEVRKFFSILKVLKSHINITLKYTHKNILNFKNIMYFRIFKEIDLKYKFLPYELNTLITTRYISCLSDKILLCLLYKFILQMYLYYKLFIILLLIISYFCF